MSAGATAGATASAAAAIAQAIKASGAIVRVDPPDFLALLGRTRTPLVVVARGGVFKKNYQYLTSYKGLAFFAKSNTPLHLPGDSEIIYARGMWMPS